MLCLFCQHVHCIDVGNVNSQAMHNFNGTSEKELSLIRGDFVVVRQASFSWVLIVNVYIVCSSECLLMYLNTFLYFIYIKTRINF